jgi:hypothetical protein
MIHRSKTLFLLVLVALGVGVGIYLGAGVYYSTTSQTCANLGCSHQLREEIFLDSYSSSFDGYIHLLIYNPGPSSATLADIYIDNSNVNFTLSPTSGTGSGCSETTRVINPSAHCIVSAPAQPSPGSTAHSVVIVTALGSTFRFSITV